MFDQDGKMILNLVERGPIVKADCEALADKFFGKCSFEVNVYFLGMQKSFSEV